MSRWSARLVLVAGAGAALAATASLAYASVRHGKPGRGTLATLNAILQGTGVRVAFEVGAEDPKPIRVDFKPGSLTEQGFPLDVGLHVAPEAAAFATLAATPGASEPPEPDRKATPRADWTVRIHDLPDEGLPVEFDGDKYRLFASKDGLTLRRTK
jgi:hypothetical protein